MKKLHLRSYESCYGHLRSKYFLLDLFIATSFEVKWKIRYKNKTWKHSKTRQNYKYVGKLVFFDFIDSGSGVNNLL